MLKILTPAQKVKFLSWAQENREKLDRVMQTKAKKIPASTSSPMFDDRFQIDKKQHVAANLYILSHRLQKVMQAIPRAAPLVTGLTLKKLSRRPSFESLGRSPNDKPGQDGEEGMSRERSFASSGSLKRSASALSMDGDRPPLTQISPDEAEETCRPAVEKVLGYLKEIIPPTPAPQYGPSGANSQPQSKGIRIPSPAHVTSAPNPGTQQPSLVPSDVAPRSDASSPLQNGSLQQLLGKEAASGHRKQSSFIPPYLNVVPEEMFPNDGTADDFLMSLVDEDWAIGEGIDMDTSN
jgi:hypothetical protein